jgi:hypothetical protein
MQRCVLVERWFELTRVVLPALAGARRWPVRHDHCFQRILLDSAVEGRWRDHIAAPAWRCASDAQLAAAVALGEAVAAGDRDLAELNRRSLAWRGKHPHQAPGRSTARSR